MYGPGGQVVTLENYKGYDNSNTDEYVENGQQCFAYFYTGHGSTHLLHQPGQWDIEAKIWIEPSGGGGPSGHTLTVNTNPNYCTVALMRDPGDANIPMGTQNSGASGQAVWTGLVEDAYGITVTKDGYTTEYYTLNLVQTTTVNINLQEAPSSYWLTINTDIHGAIITCNGIQEVWEVGNPWKHQLPGGTYVACANYAGNQNCISINLVTDQTEFIQLFGMFQIITGGMFSITNVKTNWERYEYNGNYLGG
jgi:hypothetical protein